MKLVILVQLEFIVYMMFLLVYIMFIVGLKFCILQALISPSQTLLLQHIWAMMMMVKTTILLLRK